MGTQVITTDTGRRLGVVGEVVVDIDRREVVALGLRDNPLTRFLPGLPKWMPLESIKQVGDVILVDSLDSLSESFSPERYGKVINCQVITESGQLLGRVLGFSFDIETGDLISLVMGAVGVPLLGEGVLSTWEIPVEEIVSSGNDRIIVYEGAEEKFKEIGKAYEALADPETRARYDQFGEAGLGGAAGMPDMGDMGGFADLFETFFNGFGGQNPQGGRTQRRGPQQGDDLRYDLNVDFKDAIFGQQREIKIPHLETCEVCRGTGAKPGTGPKTCSTCGGSGQVRRATRTPFGNFTQVAECPSCNGAGQIIADPCLTCGGNGV